MTAAVLERPEVDTPAPGDEPHHLELCCYPGEAYCGHQGGPFFTKDMADAEEAGGAQTARCLECGVIAIVRTRFLLSCADVRAVR